MRQKAEDRKKLEKGKGKEKYIRSTRNQDKVGFKTLNGGYFRLFSNITVVFF